MTSASDGGIHAQLRLIISGIPEERFDASGAEVLQLRGAVVDGAVSHPPAVVRFRGQRRAELFRWAKAGKHLSVEGMLEVKSWSAGGKQHLALLVEAANIYPLSDVEVIDPSRAGVYGNVERAQAGAGRPKRASKAESAEIMRRALERTDA
jgi:hypothetical protein